jgi:tetratricopeptide (TPR) repeat protein
VLREHVLLSFALARSYIIVADSRWQAEIAETVRLAGRVASLPGATIGDRARAAVIVAEQSALTSGMLSRNPELEALANRAVAVVEALAAEKPDDSAVLEALAQIYQRTARTYTAGNRTPQSVRLSIDFNRKAIAAAEKILAAKPEDVRWLKFRASSLVELSKTLARAGEYAEADRTIGEALQLSAQHYARDPNNVELAIERLMTLENASTAAYRVGDMERTVRFARETIAQGGRIPEASRNTTIIRSHISESKALIGGALLVMARAPSLDREKRLSMLTEARLLLTGHIAFLDEARRDKLGALDADVDKEVMAAIKACDEAIAKLSRH